MLLLTALFDLSQSDLDFVDVCELICRQEIALDLLAVDSHCFHAALNMIRVLDVDIQLFAAEQLVNLEAVPCSRN